MQTCSFCDDQIPKGTGIIFAKKDGTVFRFCSSKCRKNLLGLKREGRRQGWTEAARKFLGKDKKKAAKKEAPEKKEKK